MSLEDELEKVARETQPDVDQLGELGVLVSDMMRRRLEIAETENHLAGMKRDYNELAIGKIPSLMAELGLSEVRTQEGARITVQREVYCKFAEGEKEHGLVWLDTNGYGALIKHEVSVEFGKGEAERATLAINALKAAGFNPQDTTDVHPMTLKAWAKRQVEGGDEIPSQYFNVNTFSIAKVKS